MTLVPSIETSYKYTFKDSSKKKIVEKLGIKIGVTAKKETFEVFLGGEIRKSLNNRNYEMFILQVLSINFRGMWFLMKKRMLYFSLTTIFHKEIVILRKKEVILLIK
ncbi:hypothetical protein LH402_10095 [Fusobacterium nucleatum]